MTSCTNCDSPMTGNYCATCGQPAHIKRINVHYIMHEIQHVLHVEKGLIYTVKELLIRPGQRVREYITENRNRLVKPVIFIIITSLIYTVISHYFHLDVGYIEFKDTAGSGVNIINDWVQNHYGYSNILMGIFIALWTKLFFRKYGYNFFEILILLCFVMGIGMLLFSVFAIAEGLSHLKLMPISAFVFFVYSAWAIGQFFDKQKFANYLKAFGAYMLGMISFSIVTTLLGVALNVFIAH